VDSKSGRIRLHDVTTLKVLRGFGEGKEGLFTTTSAMFAPDRIDPTDVKDLVASDAFTRDGKRLVVGLDSGRVEVWDTATGKRLSSFDGPKRGDGVSLTEVLPDGKHIMIREPLLGSDGSEVFKGRSVYTFDGRLVRREPDVRDVRFDPSGRSVAVVRWTPDNGDRPREHTVTIYDAAAWLAGGAKKE